VNDTVQQVIPVLRENRRKFEEFCYSLSEEELARPVPNSSWIVKDFASHLCALDLLFADYIDSVRAGGQVDMRQTAEGGSFNLDTWNDAQVADRRERSLADIFAEAETNRERLVASLGLLSDDDVNRTMHFSDPKRGEADFPLKAFLVGWAQHDPIHAADMLKALPERADDAELTSWLTNPFVTGYQKSMNSAPHA